MGNQAEQEESGRIPLSWGVLKGRGLPPASHCLPRFLQAGLGLLVLSAGT